jgi:hypothetical protein
MHIDVAIFTEAKLTNDIYSCWSDGYRIMAIRATSPNQGGLALVWKESNHYCLESINLHGPNTLSFQLVAGGRRWLIVGVYMSPNEPATSICQHIIHLCNQHPNLPLIVTGDFIICFNDNNYSIRDLEIINTLKFVGISNMLPHFKQRKPYRDHCTWRQFRDGQLIQSQCDYVLSDESRKLFKSIRIINPRHYDSYHFAICFTLYAKAPKQHK